MNYATGLIYKEEINMELLGRTINNKYKITNMLGEGGMSTVYQAKDIEGNKNVALKFLKKSVTSFYIEDVIRFKKEAETVSKLSHPHILKLYGTSEYNNTPYLIEELLEGTNLSDLIKKATMFKINDVVDIICQIAEALSYVHNNGIIHRDIKLGNIMVNKEKDHYFVKLLDFGTSFVMELNKIKETNEIIGTFGYMSPEATGILNKRIDERSDYYSLGIIFYQLLSGKLPFTATEMNKLLHQQIATNPPELKKIKPDIPIILEKIVMKLLRKDPELRYQSARGLLYDLQRYQKGELDFVIGEKDQKRKLSYQTCLIGREEETQKLIELYHEAEESQGNICLLAGKAGVGKSKLVEEIKGYAYEHGGIFIHGKCLSQENKTPYQPFRDVINEYINIIEKVEKVEKEKQIDRIKGILGDLGEIIVRLNPNIKLLLDKVPELVPLEPERENQRFLMVASDFFCNFIEQGKACVLYLDDLQWADEGSLSLINEMAGKINNTNLFILATYRDNEINEDHDLNKIIMNWKEKNIIFEELALKPFDYNRLNKFISTLLGETGEEAKQLTQYILKQSKGNPFFAINILRKLVEEKALIWQGVNWKENWEKINAMPVPSTIIDIILRRIEDLAERLNELLSIGAVIGREFEMTLLFKLLHFEREEVVRLVDEGIEKQLLERSLKRGNVIFVHDRIRSAFYQKIGEKKRRELHLNIGNAIEELNNENIDDVIFDLANHYTEAREKEKILRYGLPAAEKAKANYANQEAIRYYKIIIDILEEKGKKESKEWIRAKNELVDVFLTIGKSDEAIIMSNEILLYIKDILEKARIYKKIGSAYFKKGNYDGCEKILSKGLKLLGENIPISEKQVTFSLIKELFVHIMHNIFSWIIKHKKGSPVKEKYKEIIWLYYPLNWMYGLTNGKKFINSILRMLYIARSKIGHSKELAQSFAAHAVLLECIPLFKKSIKYYEKSIIMRQELNDEWGIAESLQLLGYCYQWKSEYQKAIEIFEQSKEKFEKVGDMWELCMALNGLGQVYQKIGEYKKCMNISDRYLNISLKTNCDTGIVSAQNIIGHCYIETGDFKDAENILKKALKLGEEKKLYLDNCDTNIYLGYLEIERANYNESIKYLEKAKKIDTENDLLKEYSVLLYPYLCEAYIEDFKLKKLNYKSDKSKEILKKIKKTCKNAINQTKSWQNNYGISLRVAAKYYILVKKNKKAEHLFIQSIDHYKKIGRKYELGIGLYEYGVFLIQNYHDSEAKEKWIEAYNIFKEIDSKIYLERTAKFLGIQDDNQISNNRFIQSLRDNQKILSIITLSQDISSILNYDQLLDTVMSTAIEISGAKRGYLIIKNDETNKSEVVVRKNIDEDEALSDEFSKNIVNRVLKNGETILTTNAKEDEEFHEFKSVIQYGLKSILCIPLKYLNNVVGVCYLDNPLSSSVFSYEDVDILNIIMSQAAISIENAKHYELAITDGLTKLITYRHFHYLLHKEINRSKRYKHTLSLIMADIDFFKDVNDKYGHQTGDEVLKNVGKIIKGLCRNIDTAARYGGDEFVVILPETDSQGSMQFGERIRKAIEKSKMTYNNNKIKITMSLGVAVAVYPDHGADKTALIKSADKAMYISKENGRNQTTVFSEFLKEIE